MYKQLSLANAVTTRNMQCAFVLLAAASLTACVAGPDFHAPDTPAVSRYTQSGAADAMTSTTAVNDTQQLVTTALPVKWWTLFQSDDLNGLIEQALAGNQSLVTAQATLQHAQALTEAKTGERYPQIDLTASSGRQRYGSEFLGSITPPPPFTYFALGPSVSYTLDFAGGIQRSIEQRRALTEFQQHQLEAAYLTLTGNVVSQAINVAAIAAQIAAIEELLTDDQRNLAMIQSAFDAGSVSRVDVLSARSQVANDTTLLPALRQQLSVARNALAVLMGQAPSNWNAPTLSLTGFAVPAALPVNVPSELAHQRPDILAAESQLHASTAAVGVATANLYPRITLSASFSQQTLEAGELFNASNRAWSLISGLTAPIFDGGRLHAEQRAAQAQVRADASRYQQTVLQSFAQVADALNALHHDGEMLTTQRQASDIAAQSLALTRDSYSEGNVGVLQVLDSERSYQQAKLGYVRAQAQQLQDTARLFLALGGAAPQAAALAATVR